MQPRLSFRSPEKELLDGDNIPFEDIRQNMRELNTINTLLGGHAITLRGFRSLLGRRKQVHVCEIGAGGGDNLEVIIRCCQKQGIRIQCTGIDIKQECTDTARSRDLPHTNWITSDYRRVAFPEKPDIIFSSLFCHHFSSSELPQQLLWMQANSRLGFFINDLHRHPLAWHSIRVLTQLFSRSYLVKNDAPLSVARGFLQKEWKTILAEAGLSDATVGWQWAFRHLIIYKHLHEASL